MLPDVVLWLATRHKVGELVREGILALNQSLSQLMVTCYSTRSKDVPGVKVQRVQKVLPDITIKSTMGMY